MKLETKLRKEVSEAFKDYDWMSPEWVPLVQLPQESRLHFKHFINIVRRTYPQEAGDMAIVFKNCPNNYFEMISTEGFMKDLLVVKWSFKEWLKHFFTGKI